MSPGWEMAFNPSHSASPAYLYGLPSADNLRIDDLLDFTNHEDLFLSSSSSATTDSSSHLLPLPDHPSSTYPADDSSNLYSFPSFPDDLYIPSEEAAELEWLSRFVDDSFSDMPPPMYTPISNQHQHQHQHQHQQQQQQHGVVEQCSVPGRARSKRSKANSLSMASQSSSPSTSSSSSEFSLNEHGNNTRSVNGSKGIKNGGGGGDAGGVRRCTHCASEKTPQWRTGPLGPKTLCNACGVRYKSGRLVPEYRPAASPTFVLTQHSNSHRKVLELRRQKELHLIRHDNHGSASAVASGGAATELLFHDYEVC